MRKCFSHLPRWPRVRSVTWLSTRRSAGSLVVWMACKPGCVLRRLLVALHFESHLSSMCRSEAGGVQTARTLRAENCFREPPPHYVSVDLLGTHQGSHAWRSLPTYADRGLVPAIAFPSVELTSAVNWRGACHMSGWFSNAVGAHFCV